MRSTLCIIICWVSGLRPSWFLSWVACVLHFIFRSPKGAGLVPGVTKFSRGHAEFFGRIRGLWRWVRLSPAGSIPVSWDVTFNVSELIKGHSKSFVAFFIFCWFVKRVTNGFSGKVTIRFLGWHLGRVCTWPRILRHYSLRTLHRLISELRLFKVILHFLCVCVFFLMCLWHNLTSSRNEDGISIRKLYYAWRMPYQG